MSSGKWRVRKRSLLLEHSPKAKEKQEQNKLSVSRPRFKAENLLLNSRNDKPGDRDFLPQFLLLILSWIFLTTPFQIPNFYRGGSLNFSIFEPHMTSLYKTRTTEVKQWHSIYLEMTNYYKVPPKVSLLLRSDGACAVKGSLELCRR
jgi:hypothetical protein